MASILLSTAGTVAGSSFGPVGALIGSQVGRVAGQFVDNAFIGGKSGRHVEGTRLADLAVQTSTYGRMLPIVYGSARIAGNIIWSRPIKEVATTTTSSTGKGGGGKVTQSSTVYSYYVSLAISICEGPIDDVLRVWADAKQLDLSQGTYRIYKGDEAQLPDSYIEGFEGVGNTPAYRGQAYVVVEDFPLADFGNRIPNFTFEVKRKFLGVDVDGESVENMITGMVMIPASGEFAYDTEAQNKIPGSLVSGSWVQQGSQESINQHTPMGKANALVSLDQLKDTCPNVEWISVVVAWFGDSLDAGDCIVKPGVEFQSGAITAPDTWAVGSYTRSTARQITLVDDTPRYGGTPDDGSLLRYLDELKERGYNILFYPIIMMDVEDKPWRGRVTGSASDVASFFTKPHGYNAFITHYANLVQDKVDALVIGSEMIGLTKVTDTPGNYPAVNALVSLAATVKGIVGDVLVSYAADWSEYHHTESGWYNLDPLWASSNIDFVGIDAYFPLTDFTRQSYDVETVKDGWTSGEGYDFYYSDPERTIEAPLTAAYAWKNLDWWWSNTHINPDTSTTSWTPESKPIWFTEFGYPSVDCGTNQPNVFYDPTSSESYFPYRSRGRVDFRAQRAGLAATLSQWSGSDMVERMFVWTWDARPYPYWPDLLSVWADGGVWKTGHWVQGKLGLSSLSAIVRDLSLRAGLEDADIDVSRLGELVEGFVITASQSVRDAIEQLQAGYFFDACESDYVLRFVPRGNEATLSITEDMLLPRVEQESRELLTIRRAQEVELPQRLQIGYINRLTNYQPGLQMAQRAATASRESVTLNLPIVFSDQIARIVADVSLFNAWMERTEYAFELPPSYAALEPADVIEVTVNGVTHTMRITAIQRGANGMLRVAAVAEDVSVYDFYATPGLPSSVIVENQAVPATHLALLDLPALPSDPVDQGVVRVAAAGVTTGWRGAVLYRSDNGGSDYARWLDVNEAAVMGAATTVLSSGPSVVFDEAGSVTVSLLGDGELASASELAVLNGANAALLGEEIIQFKTATFLEPGKYRLSNLLRGRLGTEFAIGMHVSGERFVLLDSQVIKDAVPTSLLGLPRLYKPVSIGSTLGATSGQSFAYTGRTLKPYSPVHVTGSRGGGGNLTLNWIRRSRQGGAWQDHVDVPLNEVVEAYEVEIMDGVNVVRTISGISAPATSYSAAQQTTDFGSPQASVTVRIYQLSALVGRGNAAEVSV